MSKKISVIGANGAKCFRIGKGHDCSCCGALDNGEDWFVFQAAWCDDDGVYYPRLCGDLDGRGCVYEVESADSMKNELLEELKAMMPNEVNDGIVSEMEDYDFMFGGK